MNNHEESKPDLPLEVKRAFENESERFQQNMQRVWHLAEPNRPIVSSSEDLDRRWARLNEIMESRSSESESHVQAPHSSNTRIFSIKYVWKYAAAASLLLLVGAYAYWALPVTVEAGYGEMVQAALPDGSTVHLNSGSALTYPRGFDGNPFRTAETRQVKLQGEAYFDVEDSEKPFQIRTFNAEIAVLGTEFNVRARPDELERSTDVTLESGRVRVSATNDHGQQVVLEEPGETVRIVEHDVARKSYDADYNLIFAWRDGRFTARDQSFEQVFAELERRFDVSITTEDSTILTESMTILMSRPGSIESTLDDICTSRNLRYRATSRGYEVYRP